MHQGLRFIAAAIAAAIALPTVASAQSLFGEGELIDLGTLGGSTSEAHAINQIAEVAGDADTASGARHGFFTSGMTQVDVGAGPGSDAFLRDMGPWNKLTGWLVQGGMEHAAIGHAEEPLTILGPGTSPSRAYAFGGYLVVGWHTNALGQREAAMWTWDGTQYPLGTQAGGVSSEARGANANETIVGFGTDAAGVDHAVAWLGSGPTVIEIAHSRAYDVDEAGLAVGYEVDPLGFLHATRWNLSTGVAESFNGLGHSAAANATSPTTGQLVGWADTSTFPIPGTVRHAYAVINGGARDLNDMLGSAAAGWVLTEAHDVNDLGDVVGVGTLNGVTRAWLLIPPPPRALDRTAHTSSGVPVDQTLVSLRNSNHPVTYQVVTPPTHGTYVVNGDVLTYTPDVGFIGNDSLTYVANAGRDDGPAGTITLSVSASGLALSETYITGSDTTTNDLFGLEAIIVGDEMFVGAPARLDDGGSGRTIGAVYCYTDSGSGWTEVARIDPPDPLVNDSFGVGLAMDGNTLVVGDSGADPGGVTSVGLAHVYVRSGPGAPWSLQATLAASDGALGDGFGHKVAVSGDTVAVSATFADDGGSAAGSVYVFTRSGGVWTEQVELNEGTPVSSNVFGQSLVLSGSELFIGTSPLYGPGHVYHYIGGGASWTLTTTLSGDDTQYDHFGESMQLDGQTLVVGASSDHTGTDGGPDGAAYVFVRSGLTFVRQARLEAADLIDDESFGRAVAIDGDRIVVTNPWDDSAGRNAGAFYVFERTGTTWSEIHKQTPPTGAGGYGLDITAGGGRIVAPAYRDINAGNSAGAVYDYR